MVRELLAPLEDELPLGRLAQLVEPKPEQIAVLAEAEQDRARPARMAISSE
jgi:hypothetical protein